MLGMHTEQLFYSYRNQDTMCQRNVSRGCLESRNVVQGQWDWRPEVYCGALCAYYILCYIIFICIMTKYEYMTCLISCIMINGHEINKFLRT
jgi:hypothetical protein